MLAGRIDAVKNASNYDNNSVQNQRVMRPQRGPEHVADEIQPTKVAGTLRRAVRSSRFAGILGGRHMGLSRPQLACPTGAEG